LSDTNKEHYLEHAVTLDRIQTNDNGEQEVVVLDELKGDPYKISLHQFAQVWNDGVLVPRRVAGILDNM